MADVIVAGAGIAGLPTGLALRRAGWSVEIVERASAPDRGGAGQYLPGNATRALGRLGLDLGRLDAAAIETQCFCDHRGRVLARVDLPSFWSGCGACLGLPRATLEPALREMVEVPIRYGVEVTGLAADGDGVEVGLSDGTLRQATLLVGADGLRSTVRRLIGDDAPLRSVGRLSWRYLVDELPGVRDWIVLLGRGRTFLLIPVGAGRVYCYADVSASFGAGPEDLRALFTGFADPVPTALDAGDPRSVHVAPIEEVVPREHTGERVVLVGDAAHSTSPNMAQGAATAAEDTLVLAEEMAGHDVATALRSFSTRRGRRITWVREQTHRRDRTRALPGAVRNTVLRWTGERLYRANYRALLEEP